MSGNHQICTFTVAGQSFGVEVARVQEVLRNQPMTRVPLASRFIRGLINLRGQIVMAVDLHRCLELDEHAREPAPMNLVIRGSDGPLSLLVDRIHDVVDVAGATFEPPPPNLHRRSRRLIRGTYNLSDQLLLALDVDRVQELLEATPDGSSHRREPD